MSSRLSAGHKSVSRRHSLLVESQAWRLWLLRYRHSHAFRVFKVARRLRLSRTFFHGWKKLIRRRQSLLPYAASRILLIADVLALRKGLKYWLLSYWAYLLMRALFQTWKKYARLSTRLLTIRTRILITSSNFATARLAFKGWRRCLSLRRELEISLKNLFLAKERAVASCAWDAWQNHVSIIRSLEAADSHYFLHLKRGLGLKRLRARVVLKRKREKQMKFTTEHRKKRSIQHSIFLWWASTAGQRESRHEYLTDVEDTEEGQDTETEKRRVDADKSLRVTRLLNSSHFQEQVPQVPIHGLRSSPN